jgi:hypothetical protein
VLEIHAIANKKEKSYGNFEIALTHPERERFLIGLKTNIGLYYDMLGLVNAEQSICSRQSDQESIHDSIRRSVGFPKLGRMVFTVMEQWMENQLRAQSSSYLAMHLEEEAMEWDSILSKFVASKGRFSEAIQIQEHLVKFYKDGLIISSNLFQRQIKVLHVSSDVSEVEKALLLFCDFRMKFMKIQSAIQTLARFYDSVGRNLHALILHQELFRLMSLTKTENAHYGHQGFLDNIAQMQSACLSLPNTAENTDSSINFCEYSLSLFRKIMGKESSEIVCDQLHILAAFLFKAHRYSDALVALEEENEMRRRLQSEYHPDMIMCMSQISKCYMALGRHQEALLEELRMLEFRQRVFPSNHPSICQSMCQLSIQCSVMGKHEEAQMWQKRQEEFCQKFLPENDPVSNIYGTDIGDLHRFQAMLQTLRTSSASSATATTPQTTDSTLRDQLHQLFEKVNVNDLVSACQTHFGTANTSQNKSTSLSRTMQSINEKMPPILALLERDGDRLSVELIGKFLDFILDGEDAMSSNQSLHLLQHLLKFFSTNKQCQVEYIRDFGVRQIVSMLSHTSHKVQNLARSIMIKLNVKVASTPPPHAAARHEHTLPRALVQRSDPKWQPDDSRDNCGVCRKEFRWWLRRHHCR